MNNIKRRDVRIFVMRSIYAAITGHDTATTQFDRILTFKPKRSAIADDELAINLLRVYDLRQESILDWISKNYDRPIALISAVEQAIMATAITEMLGYPATPKAIIIDEAIEMTRLYGDENGYELVNGILEKVNQQLGNA